MNLVSNRPQRLLSPAAILVLLAALVVLPTAGCGGSGEDKTPPQEEKPTVTTMRPGQGITVQQVDFDYPGGRLAGSTWGRILLDAKTLSAAADLRKGYVSVVTAKGWAVTNVPVPDVEEPPHAIYFDLGLAEPGPITETRVDVKHSNLAIDDIREYVEDRIPFPVETWVDRAHGIGPDNELEKLLPPTDPPHTIDLTQIPVFQVQTFSNTQAITNIQCAYNQCFPMATANGLQFMEDSGWLTIPNDHSQGIGVVGDPTIATLVGQLDVYASRSVTSRLIGSGVWFEPMIDGTFEYLQDNGLDGILTFRHQDRGYGSTIPAGDYSAFGSTSLDDGATVSWTWINDRITGGCAVSLVYVAHVVRITGSGRTLGMPWIRYSHDSNQTNDSSGLENVVTYLTDPDSDGLLNMDGSSREIRWVWAACP